MTDDKELFELSRRKALAGIGTIGAASAGAGLGTSAFFSDTESFDGNSLQAGTLDMKAAYSAHYSDWLPNDQGLEEDANIAESDIEMWDGPPGTTGGSGDLNDGWVGLPSNDAWLIQVASAADADEFLANTQYADEGVASCPNGTDAQDIASPVIELDDVKPGDFGEVTFSFNLCTNPGYVWMNGDVVENVDNGKTEPEEKDPDEPGAPTFNLTFDSADDATIVQDSDPITSEQDPDGNADEPSWPDASTVDGPTWLVDRWAPDGFGTDTVGGETALCVSVDEDGPTKDYPDDTFYDYHGVKYVTDTGGNGYWNAGDGSTVSSSFYVDPEWEGDGENQASGIWVQGGDEFENITVYSILEYRDSDTAAADEYTDSDQPGFYVYAQTSPGEYGFVYAGLPSGFDPDTGGWVDIEYELDAGTAHRWSVNGEELYADTAASYDGTTRIQVPFINSLNFGVDQEYCYDDFALTRSGTELGELAQEVQAAVWYDDDCDNVLDSGEEVIMQGTLAEVLSALSSNDGRGIPLDGDLTTSFDETGGAENSDTRDCFDGTTEYCFGFAWWLPADHANEIQTDRLVFDLGFYTEQCRHNDGSGQAPEGSMTPGGG
jgi:predicted ribosomally synthesized peptide with SipW-like signal peptide